MFEILKSLNDYAECENILIDLLNIKGFELLSCLSNNHKRISKMFEDLGADFDYECRDFLISYSLIEEPTKEETEMFNVCTGIYDILNEISIVFYDNNMKKTSVVLEDFYINNQSLIELIKANL